MVRLVADGLPNREVAERLYISPHTVSGHLRHAFEKLGISSRVALSRLAVEHQDRDRVACRVSAAGHLVPSAGG